MDYRWIISQSGDNYGWAILDAKGERVSSGVSSSRAAAIVAAERARVRIREAERLSKSCRTEGNETADQGDGTS
jgi:hypothetical protein